MHPSRALFRNRPRKTASADHANQRSANPACHCVVLIEERIHATAALTRGATADAAANLNVTTAVDVNGTEEQEGVGPDVNGTEKVVATATAADSRRNMLNLVQDCGP